MAQRTALIDALKRELKRQGKTYKDVAQVLDLSEASVKRLFAEHNLSLERLDRLCDWLELEFSDLVTLMARSKRQTTRLTLQQEQELAADNKLLLLTHFLINGLSFTEITQQYAIEEHEGIRLLAKLDKLKVIELLPNNRVKLRIARQFEWIPNGPIARFYEQHIQADFLKSSFSGEDETRLFLSGLLTRGSHTELLNKIRQLSHEFADISQSDQSAMQSERHGTSLIVAMRPWEPEVFRPLRRPVKQVSGN